MSKNFATVRPSAFAPVRYITVKAITYYTDAQIGTELDNQFLYFRIGHAGKGSHHPDVTDLAHWLSKILCALDG